MDQYVQGIGIESPLESQYRTLKNLWKMHPLADAKQQLWTSLNEIIAKVNEEDEDEDEDEDDHDCEGDYS